jgi:hypothetical protein
MSKNTKIIAIVGGALIVIILGYTLIFGGGFGQALEVVGCGSKKEATKPRVNIEAFELSDCLTTGFACQRDDKGQPKMAKGAKECDKKPAPYCKTLWGNKCKDAKFKTDNKSGCEKFGKAAAKEDDKDDD